MRRCVSTKVREYNIAIAILSSETESKMYGFAPAKMGTRIGERQDIYMLYPPNFLPVSSNL
jgi:hypothetical protein